MRRFVVVLIMVAGILFVCACSLFYVQKINDEIERYSGAVFVALNNKDHAEIAQAVSTFTDYWNEKEKHIIFFVRHSQINDITKSVSQLNSLVMFEDYATLHAELSSIVWQMNHISTSESPTPRNLM